MCTQKYFTWHWHRMWYILNECEIVIVYRSIFTCRFSIVSIRVILRMHHTFFICKQTNDDNFRMDWLVHIEKVKIVFVYIALRLNNWNCLQCHQALAAAVVVAIHSIFNGTHCFSLLFASLHCRKVKVATIEYIYKFSSVSSTFLFTSFVSSKKKTQKFSSVLFAERKGR